MSTPASSGGPTPLRVAGFALIGVGAVAALIALATLLPGGGGPQTAAPTATVSVAPTDKPTVPPSAPATAADTGPVAVPSFGTVPADGAAAPGSRAGAAKETLRVYNNSTIKGLAARAADDFRANGWPVGSVANYPSGIISTSTVYYRPGTAEQAAASTLGEAFGLRIQPRFTGLDQATPGLIVIVTNDYQRR